MKTKIFLLPQTVRTPATGREAYLEAAVKHYRLTDDDLATLQKMSDTQAEVFLMKRCRKLGILPLDPSEYGLE